MNVMRKHSFFIVAIFLLGLMFLPQQGLMSAPKRYDYAAEANTALKEMRDSLDDMRHEANNRESEMKVLEEKFSTFEASLDSLRQQILDNTQANKELLKGNSTSLESKINSLETTSKGLVGDIKQLKTHANDSSTALEQVESRFGKLEKMLEAQSKNLGNLEIALSSIMDAIQIKDTPVEKKSSKTSSKAVAASGATGKTYKVRSGDSLEKIAKENGTTIKMLKEVNQLSNDKIIVGQTLELP